MLRAPFCSCVNNMPGLWKDCMRRYTNYRRRMPVIKIIYSVMKCNFRLCACLVFFAIEPCPRHCTTYCPPPWGSPSHSKVRSRQPENPTLRSMPQPGSFRTSESTDPCFCSLALITGNFPVASALARSRRTSVEFSAMTWLHARCIGISNTEYSDLQKFDDLWCCKQCLETTLPFHDISTSDSVFDTSASFSIVRRDRSRHGGGIAIYVHDSIPFKLRLKHPPSS